MEITLEVMLVFLIRILYRAQIGLDLKVQLAVVALRAGGHDCSWVAFFYINKGSGAGHVCQNVGCPRFL